MYSLNFEVLTPCGKKGNLKNTSQIDLQKIFQTKMFFLTPLKIQEENCCLLIDPKMKSDAQR